MVVCIFVVMNNLIISKSRSFIVLGVSTQYDITPSGNEKVYHVFKKLFVGDSLDSALVFIFRQSNGRFRIVRRAGKRFLPTLTCVKQFNIIEFI